MNFYLYGSSYLQEVVFLNNPSDHETRSIRCHVGINVDFTPILHPHAPLVPRTYCECGEYPGTPCGILSTPHYIVTDLNNVMCTLMLWQVFLVQSLFISHIIVGLLGTYQFVFSVHPFVYTLPLTRCDFFSIPSSTKLQSVVLKFLSNPSS